MTLWSIDHSLQCSAFPWRTHMYLMKIKLTIHCEKNLRLAPTTVNELSSLQKCFSYPIFSTIGLFFSFLHCWILSTIDDWHGSQKNLADILNLSNEFSKWEIGFYFASWFQYQPALPNPAPWGGLTTAKSSSSSTEQFDFLHSRSKKSCRKFQIHYFQ